MLDFSISKSFEFYMNWSGFNLALFEDLLQTQLSKLYWAFSHVAFSTAVRAPIQLHFLYRSLRFFYLNCWTQFINGMKVVHLLDALQRDWRKNCDGRTSAASHEEQSSRIILIFGNVAKFIFRTPDLVHSLSTSTYALQKMKNYEF